MALSWEELDALITETLAERRVAGPNSFAGPMKWDCVDNDGEPRTVPGFSAAAAVEHDARQVG